MKIGFEKATILWIVNSCPLKPCDILEVNKSFVNSVYCVSQYAICILVSLLIIGYDFLFYSWSRRTLEHSSRGRPTDTLKSPLYLCLSFIFKLVKLKNRSLHTWKWWHLDLLSEDGYRQSCGDEWDRGICPPNTVGCIATLSFVKLGKHAVGHLEDFRILKQTKNAERTATAIHTRGGW
jgi:hypothetical protein